MATEEPHSSKLDRLYDFPTKELCVPALKVGALTGTTGLLVGGTSALLRSSRTPTLFAIASSIQWFLLGSTFTLTRSTLIHIHTPSISAPPTRSETLYGPYPTPPDRLYASTLAGGITGLVVSAITRGRRNVIPATVVWMGAGWAGQNGYEWADGRHSRKLAASVKGEGEGKKEVGFWNRVADMKWSPMRRLSDEEYSGMLRRRLLSVEAQIALVDEEIEKLRDEEKDGIYVQSREGQGKP